MILNVTSALVSVDRLESNHLWEEKLLLFWLKMFGYFVYIYTAGTSATDNPCRCHVENCKASG